MSFNVVLKWKPDYILTIDPRRAGHHPADLLELGCPAPDSKRLKDCRSRGTEIAKFTPASISASLVNMPSMSPIRCPCGSTSAPRGTGIDRRIRLHEILDGVETDVAAVNG